MTGADVRVGNYRYLLNQQTLNRKNYTMHFTDNGGEVKHLAEDSD